MLGKAKTATFSSQIGIYVQVATPDDSKLAKNDITLVAAGKE